MTAGGWAVIVAALALLAVTFVRGSVEAGRRATEKEEVAREETYMRRVNAWIGDTASTAPPPDTAGHPVPTSDRAKRMWVVSRMLVDRALWQREVMERHGGEDFDPPPAWEIRRYAAYVANARGYPGVGTDLEGRAAAMAEIEKTSAAWMDARTAALARASGLPASRVRDLFPRDFAGVTPDEARYAQALLEMHRHLVRVDPRVHPAGGNRQRWENEDEVNRFDELLAKQNDAGKAVSRARVNRLAGERAALARAIE